jgi:hypothetical protein
VAVITGNDPRFTEVIYRALLCMEICIELVVEELEADILTLQPWR